LMRPPPRLAAGTYAHVMSNPPFFEANSGRQSPQLLKHQANMETETTLEHWIKFCLLMVKPKGYVSFIYATERLDELLSLLNGKLGDIVVYPLWPSVGKPSKRVIVQGVKGSNGPLKLMPGLYLHEQDGKYTQAADNILRHAQSLNING
jgi:tRNA1(Val) A37 N6-methylase TrmN6